MKSSIVCLSLASLSLASWAFASSSRGVYLNGVDISAAKNQSISQVDIKIDSKGDIYITAPQYEVQQETSFVPLGRQSLGQSSAIEHKKPGPLDRRVQNSPAASPEELVSAPETSDTLSQPEVLDPSPAAQAPMAAKEGTRIPTDANTPPQGGPGSQVSGSAPKNP